MEINFLFDNQRVFVKECLAIAIGREVVLLRIRPLLGKVIKQRFTNIWMNDNTGWKLTFRDANNICMP